MGQSDALRIQKQKLRPGFRGEATGGLPLVVLSAGFLPSVLHSVDHPAGAGGQPVVLRGVPKHAPQDTKLQLLSGRVGHCRLWLLDHSAASLAEQHHRLEGVQQRRLVRDVGLRERCLQLFERLVDRRVHGGEVHRRSVSPAQTSHMHHSQGEDHRAGAGDSCFGEPLVFLCHRWGGNKQRRRGILRLEGGILGDNEDHQHNRQHRQSNRAARAYHRDEHHDHEEPAAIQQAIQDLDDVHRLSEQGPIRHQFESDSGE